MDANTGLGLGALAGSTGTGFASGVLQRTTKGQHEAKATLVGDARAWKLAAESLEARTPSSSAVAGAHAAMANAQVSNTNEHVGAQLFESRQRIAAGVATASDTPAWYLLNSIGASTGAEWHGDEAMRLARTAKRTTAAAVGLAAAGVALLGLEPFG